MAANHPSSMTTNSFITDSIPYDAIAEILFDSTYAFSKLLSSKGYQMDIDYDIHHPKIGDFVIILNHNHLIRSKRVGKIIQYQSTVVTIELFSKEIISFPKPTLLKIPNEQTTRFIF